MKRVIFFLFISLALITSIFACEPPKAATSSSPEQQSDLFIVSRVVDGDTIVLKNDIKVRYIGIDTPETKHPKKPVQYFGKEAFEANKRLVEGKRVNLEYDVQQTDKYGRTLAYVYLEDGTFVNAWLVENGYARVSTYPPNVKYQELFHQLEQRAREGKKGLWGKDKLPE